jgi:ATP-binding cassette subfamily B protein
LIDKISLPGNRLLFFIHFIKKQSWGFAFLAACSFVVALATTVWPMIIGDLIDSLTEYTGDKVNVFLELRGLFISALSFWVFVEVMMRLQGVMMAIVYPRLETNIRMETFEYVNHHSHAYFNNSLVGGIANRISDLPRSAYIIFDFAFANLLPTLFGIIIATFFFSRLDVTLASILSCWLGLHLLICTVASARAALLSKEHSEARTTLLGKIVDVLVNHLNVKLYSKFKYEIKNIKRAQDDERTKNRFTLFFIEKIKFILSILGFFGVSGLCYLTVRFWQVDRISIGDMVFIFNTTLNVLILLWTATAEMTYLFRELGVVKQALRIVKDPIDIIDSKNAKELEVKKGKIEFRKVTFDYKNNDNVFKEKSITIKGGQKIGLVGVSGSGKTTFAHLLLRLFDITKGSILIDNQDISKVSLKSLRENISFIPQEPILFHRSIMENIRYGDIEATDEEVIEAAKKANCHEFVMNLEEGYDTVVGEKGSKISGGQKQRIAIARAILQDAPILIMDEATSALDTYTEKQIQDSIKYLSKKKTSIIIAHRLSTLQEVDRILVFERGTIVEDGTHRELLSKKGYYHMLWKMQTEGILPTTLED